MSDDGLLDPREKDPLISRAWGWWKVVWTILRNLIYIAVILLTFGKVSTAFENLVLCFLILTYESVTWTGTLQTRLAIEEAFSNKRLLLKILSKAGEEMEDLEEDIGEAQKSYVKQNKIYYVNVAFSLVVYFIVLWKVFTTLFD
jgi:hypothetical protein